METGNKKRRIISLLVYSIGILIGMAIAGGIIWSDLETSLFDSAISPDSLLQLNCPVAITEHEIGIISATIENPTEKEKSFFVQISGEIKSDMDSINSELDKFTAKFEKYLEKGVLHIYFKHHGQTYNDIPLVLCKIKISSPKGSFVGKGEGWGEVAAFHIALDHVERHILKMKGMIKEQWVEKRLLDKINF